MVETHLAAIRNQQSTQSMMKNRTCVSVCLFSEIGLDLLKIAVKKGVGIARVYISSLDPALSVHDVRKICVSHSLDIVVLTQGQTIDQLSEKTLDSGILLLLWWPFILTKNEISSYKHVINIHPSLLPYGRGKYGYVWSILNDEPFGATLHLVDEGIDSGPILAQRQINVLPTDTGGDLYEKGIKGCMKLFEDNICSLLSEENIESLIHERNGDVLPGSYHSKADFEKMCRGIKEEDISLEVAIRYLRSRTFRNGESYRYYEHGKTYECTVNIREVE